MVNHFLRKMVDNTYLLKIEKEYKYILILQINYYYII